MRSLVVSIAVLAMSVFACAAHAIEERAVEVNGLHGTLILPEGEAWVPAALILAGSGPVDRDGNMPGMRNDSLRLLAEELAVQGIATLRADKRGVAESAPAVPREEDLRFGTYVDDAVSWLSWLSEQTRVDRVFLIGHSEGALVATLAERSMPVSGVMLLAGAGQPAGMIIERQLAAAGAPAALQAASQRIARSLEAGEKVTDVPEPLLPLYRASVQDYLISWFRLDPAQSLSEVSAPVMIVQGTTDLQVSMDDFMRLKGARPGARTLVVEGMNHDLKNAPGDRNANLATYLDPALPLAPALVPALAAFIAP